MLRVRRCHILLLLCVVARTGLAAEPTHPKQAGPADSPPPEPPAPKTFARAECLVSTDVLAERLQKKDPGLLIVDARAQEEYRSGHLPGARNIQSDLLQDAKSPPYFMPSAEQVASACGEAGIHGDSQVVIYDEDDGRLAARVWFTLHAYGHEHLAILDGGAGKWRAENRAWSTEAVPPAQPPGTFKAAEKLRGLCAFDGLSQFRVRVHSLGKLPPTTLLDARSTPEYMGEEVRGKAGGHIPGAANIEWSALLTGKEHTRVWRSPPEIHTLLRMAGVELEQKICVYDQAGGRSAHLYFTLWLMGFEHVSNYAAGWREYGNRDDVEIEK
ncbi:MAG TPA: sulfurtransferase [Planctomycetota bacterium]|jgi:3-mercaptopyruvate sulfurtransferase SseA